MKHFNGRSSEHELRRAMYVLNMNRHKPKARQDTIQRMEMAVVDACRAIVKEHDDAEAYRWYLLQWQPDATTILKPPYVVVP